MYLIFDTHVLGEVKPPSNYRPRLDARNHNNEVGEYRP